MKSVLRNILFPYLGILLVALAMVVSSAQAKPTEAELTDIVSLLNQAQSIEEAGQILESSALPSLYPLMNFGWDYIPDRTPVQVPLRAWRILAQYAVYSGYHARTIYISGNRESAVASLTMANMFSCLIHNGCSMEIGNGQEIATNIGSFGFNKKAVNTDVLFQEIRGFLNSLILISDSNICELMKQGLTTQELNNVMDALSFVASRNFAILLNDFRKDLTGRIRSCYSEKWAFSPASYSQSWKCVDKSQRVYCKKN